MLNYRFFVITFIGSYLIFLSSSCDKEPTSTPTPTPSSPIEICTSSSDSETSDYFNSNTTLKNHNTSGVDYIIGCGLTINKNITIEPGVTIWMERDAYIVVDDGGQINASGTTSEPIIIEGKNQTEEWYVLELRKGDNVLEYVNIKNAGYGTEKSTVYVAHSDANLTMRNCNLSKGAGYGLWVQWKATTLSFSNNTITSHQKAPIYVTANQVSSIDKASNLTGNTENFVQVAVSAITSSALWNKLVLDYRAVSTDPQAIWIELDALNTLTIEAGATIEFSNETGIRANKGVLKIDGTTSAPIHFKGIGSGTGLWRGVYIDNAQQHSISHTTIDGAGGWGTDNDPTPAANVMVEFDGSLTISNCTLKNSKYCGLSSHKDAVVSESNITYSGNGTGEYCKN
ncbi:MAG: hypothetical protein GY810_23890 [Aureispira sp.]|nr:hypothetical protein [Aureispira sp.]